MNWKPNQPPMSDIAPTLARTSEAERRIPSRTSGRAVRRSMATNAVIRAATAAREPIVRTEAQPASGASTTVNTSSSMDAVRVTAPARSKPRRAPAGRPESGTSLSAAISVISAIGAGSRKTQRQPISVSRPPKTRPSEKPVAPVAA